MVWLMIGAALIGLGLGCRCRVTTLIVASAVSVPVVVLFGVAVQWSMFNLFFASIAMLVALQLSYLLGLYLTDGIGRHYATGPARKFVDRGSLRSNTGLGQDLESGVSSSQDPDAQ